MGISVPYTALRILEFADYGSVSKECATDEVGEICVSSPAALVGNPNVDQVKNKLLYADTDWLRTGDLGILDEDGYHWNTDRAKDLSIRGGQNLDPATIEEALSSHEGIAFFGAVGQPDAGLGEAPCAYVELGAGASVSSEELAGFAKKCIESGFAPPERLEIVDGLPKMAVAKVHKPDLRKRGLAGMLRERVAVEGLSAEVSGMRDDPKLGLAAQVSVVGDADAEAVNGLLGEYAVAWELEDSH